jgi:hypothetical protein
MFTGSEVVRLIRLGAATGFPFRALASFFALEPSSLSFRDRVARHISGLPCFEERQGLAQGLSLLCVRASLRRSTFGWDEVCRC